MRLLFACLLLGACTPSHAIKGFSVVKTAGTERVADRALKRNEQHLCKWPTIGSLERRYGNNPTKYKDYRKFCGHHD